MKTKIAIAIALGILVLMSLVQGLQISSLDKLLKETGIAAQSKSDAETAQAAQYGTVPSSAPAMVGGC